MMRFNLPAEELVYLRRDDLFICVDRMDGKCEIAINAAGSDVIVERKTAPREEDFEELR